MQFNFIPIYLVNKMKPSRSPTGISRDKGIFVVKMYLLICNNDPKNIDFFQMRSHKKCCLYYYALGKYLCNETCFITLS